MHIKFVIQPLYVYLATLTFISACRNEIKKPEPIKNIKPGHPLSEFAKDSQIQLNRLALLLLQGWRRANDDTFLYRLLMPQADIDFTTQIPGVKKVGESLIVKDYNW